MLKIASGIAAYEIPGALAAAFAMISWLLPDLANAQTPIIYSSPYHQSAVEARPLEPLLLVGHHLNSDDTIVYRHLQDGSVPPSRLAQIPEVSTSSEGTARLISSSGKPYSLIAVMPQYIDKYSTYAIWVVTPGGNWSNPSLVNDARPQWFGPSILTLGNSRLNRTPSITVVGRNLQPRSGRSAAVRLIGSTNITITRRAEKPADNRDSEYSATFELPTDTPPGVYRVYYSRNGATWARVGTETLEVRVRSPLPAPQLLSSGRFGRCIPNDEQDDTLCFVRALKFLSVTGGDLELQSGTWDLRSQDMPDQVASTGLVVPPHVTIRAAPGTKATIRRWGTWNRGKAVPIFSLSSHTRISGLTFLSAQAFTPADRQGEALRLGTQDVGTDSQDQNSIDDVEIDGNSFERVFLGVRASGYPLNRIRIHENIFSAYTFGLQLGGNRYAAHIHFTIQDSYIADNLFIPSELSSTTDGRGPIASEIGASRRLLFVRNVADGSKTSAPPSAGDSAGWRAAFFWHLTGNQEQLLIAENTATCTGDKLGDGEAIALDNNANTFAFDTARSVVAATANSITLKGVTAQSQEGTAIPGDTYYIGHWVQVGAGPGIGQSRRIAAYKWNDKTNTTTFVVEPKWDVVPATGQSLALLGRMFWQALVVSNHVDHRAPHCRKSNQTKPRGGAIAVWAQATDLVVADNIQYDTDGILFQQMYNAPYASCARDCVAGSIVMNFLHISRNRIIGEYDRSRSCSSSGIFGSQANSPGALPPFTASYGVDISHNQIRAADASVGGSIAIAPTWYKGPQPGPWPLTDQLLIYSNDIDGATDSPARRCSSTEETRRIGINLADGSLTKHAFIYNNHCEATVPVLLDNRAVEHPCEPDDQLTCGCTQ